LLAHGHNELDNLAADTSTSSAVPFDWSRLLLAGSILARSDQSSDQEAALGIATTAQPLAMSAMTT